MTKPVKFIPKGIEPTPAMSPEDQASLEAAIKYQKVQAERSSRIAARLCGTDIANGIGFDPFDW